MERRAAQQMGQLPLRPLGAFSQQQGEVAEEVEEEVTMKAMGMEREVMEKVVVQLAEEQEEEAAEAEEDEEEAVEAEGAPLGEALANPQTMARTQTQSQIQPATLADGRVGSDEERGPGQWTFYHNRSDSYISCLAWPRSRGISRPQTRIPLRETRRTSTDSSPSLRTSSRWSQTASILIS